MKRKQLITTIGLIFGLLVLYSEGGVWRVLSLISVVLGLFAAFAYWLFERADRRKALLHVYLCRTRDEIATTGIATRAIHRQVAAFL
jgi:hypothetical protein